MEAALNPRKKFKQATEAYEKIVRGAYETMFGQSAQTQTYSNRRYSRRRANVTQEFRTRHGYSAYSRPEGLVNMTNSLYVVGIFFLWALASEEPEEHLRKRLDTTDSGWG